jgi:murein DD-endopeptidase MepM/ murein hydrolase activator NlpD
VVQGRATAAFVASDEPLTALTARVLLPTGAEYRFRGFELPTAAYRERSAIVAVDLEQAGAAAASADPPESAVRVWVFLIAVPTEVEASPGELSIEGTTDADERRFAWGARLDVFPADTAEMRIALTSELTALRTRDDARSRQDQERLASAIATFSPDAVHQIGPMAHPLPGAPESAGFGDRREYEYANGSVARSTHRGLDFAAPLGTRVVACARGRVLLAGDLLVTGRTVAVEHLPGVISLYFHLSRIDVHEGDLLEQGQPIGRVGATGLATGAHLHWEVRTAGVAIDPRRTLAAPLVDKSAVFRIIAAYPNHAKRR